MGGFVDQVVGTALLMAVVLAVTDQRNNAPPAWLTPVLVGGIVVAIGVAFGFNAGYAINPARDLGPRLFTAVAGWGGGVFTAAGGWWWVPVVAPCVGAVLGAFAYDLLVTRHHPPTGCGGAVSPFRSRALIRARRRAAPSCSIAVAASDPVAHRPSRSSRSCFRRRATSSTIPEAIWTSQLATAREAIAQGRHHASRSRGHRRHQSARDDRAVGARFRPPDRQRHRVAEPDHRADLRSAQGGGPRGALPQQDRAWSSIAYFSGTKIKHLLDSHDGLRARAARGEILFGTIDSFLIWRLTRGRVHITDVSNASRTLLFNIHTLEWDDELLQHPRRAAGDAAGGAIVERGLRRDRPGAASARPVPVAGIAGDQQAALFGQACFEPGAAKNTYGTGCFMLLNTGESPVPSQKGLLTTVAWKIGGRTTYALEGSVFVAGAAVQWLRDGLKAIAASADVEALMQQVPDTDGVYLVPAFVGLGAPYWDPRARGIIVGLTRNTTVAHVARAAVDAMAYQTRDVLEVMQEEAGLALTTLKVDGGAAANAMLLQFQADLLGVSRCGGRSSAKRRRWARRIWPGSPWATGTASTTCAATGRSIASSRRERPRSDSDRLYAGWKKAVERSLAWAE